MIFGSVYKAAELKFSGTSSWSMVSILDFLHHFSSQFIKNGSAMQTDPVVYKLQQWKIVIMQTEIA